MNLTERRNLQLRYQREMLLGELADWRRISAPGTLLERQGSQIGRITTVLEGFVDALPESTAATADLQALDSALTFALRIWEYFRPKYRLRMDLTVRDVLTCIDEYVFACYYPVINYALRAGTLQPGDVREAPLTFFTTDDSPYAIGSNMPFAPQGVSSSDVLKFGPAILKLPVSQIVVPWKFATFLPATVLLPSEIGIIIDRDFMISQQMADRLAALPLPSERLSCWTKWIKRLFADAYGVLCGGAAFVAAMTDILADSADVIAAERNVTPDCTDYPGRGLRVLFNLALLDELGLEDEDLRQTWLNTYPSHGMQDFEPDIPAIVAAILTTPIDTLGGVPIVDVMRTTPADWKATKATAKVLRNGFAFPKSTPIRQSMTAAAWVFYSDPARYTGATNRQTVDTILQTISDGESGNQGLIGAYAAAQKIEQSQAETIFIAAQNTADRAAGSIVLRLQEGRLPGGDFKRLSEAMEQTFTPFTLRRMVRSEMDKDPEKIMGEGNMEALVYALVDWAERNGELDNLINAAMRASPNSPHLKLFLESR